MAAWRSQLGELSDGTVSARRAERLGALPLLGAGDRVADMEFTSPRAGSEARPRRTLAGTTLRTAAWCGLAGLVVVVTAVVIESDPWGHRKRNQDSAPGRTTRISQPVNNVDVPTLPSETPPPGSGAANIVGTKAADGTNIPPRAAGARDVAAATERLMSRVKDAVVVIETADSDNSVGIGCGFLVREDGLIATNFHVMSNATRARVRFSDDVVYDVAGYAAVEADTDLAIVQVGNPPHNRQPLAIAGAGDPPQLAPVVAIGHPQGLRFSPVDGKVSRVVNTSALPPNFQRFLRRTISGLVDPRWIQHTADLSEGNSGGPLLDAEGRVIGINTWVDQETRFGYALHAAHLSELLERADLRPGGPRTLEPLKKYARHEARSARAINELSAEGLERLFAAARAMRWLPASEADYETLEDLAWSVTVINLPRTFTNGQLDDRLDELTRVADRVTKDLSKQKWDFVGQVTLINERAAERISRPMSGVVFFATLERVVEGDNGARGAIFKLAGADQPIFVPLEEQLVVPQPGLQCLVLGINYAGHTVRYGDNPLKLIVAPVIATRTIIPLE